MKKLIFIIIITALLGYGCTIEDDPISDENLILGKWSGNWEYTVYEDGREEFINSEICKINHIYEFKEDGSFYLLDFVQNGVDSCTENTITEPIGSWERISNGKYKLTLISSEDGSDIIIAPYLIEFPGPNSMHIRFNEKEENLPEGSLYTYMSFIKSELE